MRRLTHHVLALTGISVLTVGAAVGSLTTSPADPRTVAAPPAVASVPAPTVPVDSRLTADALDQRELRESRSEQRAALSASVAAGERQRALAKQQVAQTQKQTRLKQREAAAKQRAAQERRAEQARQRAKEAEQRAERRAADRAAAKAKSSGYDSGDSPKTIARKMMQSKYGWGASEFRCYNNIIMRESVWKVHADNPTSSAYGIPQALPGRKMASAGPDWRDNPATQITWGLGYVKSRYGTPCQAWSFKQAHDWY